MDETNQVVKTKKIDAAGKAYYGEKFKGYMLLKEVNDLIPAFKDFYYEVMQDYQR